MINENMVLYKAKSLFGLDNAALASLNCVCHLFCLELFSRLKDKKAANDERIIYLAAVNCLYYSILENTDSGCSVESVKAGDVTVKEDASMPLKKAAELKGEAEKLASPLLIDDGFVFTGVYEVFGCIRKDRQGPIHNKQHRLAVTRISCRNTATPLQKQDVSRRSLHRNREGKI